MGDETPAPEAAPVGRPSKYTPEVVERICELLRKGMPRVRAARRAGIAVSTFMDWMNVRPEFSERVHDAEDYWVEKAIGKVSDLLDSDDERIVLQAAKFGLTTRFREDFSTRSEQTGPDGSAVRHEVSGPNGGPVQTQVVPLFSDEQLATLTPEQLSAAIAAMAVKTKP